MIVSPSSVDIEVSHSMHAQHRSSMHETQSRHKRGVDGMITRQFEELCMILLNDPKTSGALASHANPFALFRSPVGMGQFGLINLCWSQFNEFDTDDLTEDSEQMDDLTSPRGSNKPHLALWM